MGSAIPKQYLPLNGQTVIEQTISRLLKHPTIEAAFISISSTDEWWPDTAYANDPRVMRVGGGAERCHSVLNALNKLSEQARPADWVLVHDAARPCLRDSDLDLLISSLANHSVGGLLGMQVRDTMKRTSADNGVNGTVDRNRLWHAYTPQMFRFGLLWQALTDALESGALVTDDASAMELAGYTPLMIEGHSDNIKITRPEDLALAEFYLQQQEIISS